jgi:hypothetical protein
MNSDEFEHKLKRQPIRRIPADWRDDILQTAREQASPAAERSRPALIRAALIAWRELIQPFRYAWTGMAALWMVFWVVNARLEITDSPTRSAIVTSAATDRIRLFEEQRQVLVELTGRIDLSPVEPPQESRPKPRSERMIGIRSC